ncbi:hypothetical protein AVEN_79654-1 [Araneus ventricosus]|uniref:Sodium channel protein Nach n=1 Tax=Araneus ventricosus TaxID=182803 RepID=A0A4Y2K3G4_ARAVE|nr:hypothetical protein AVEN_79654-1 [Araneus ventricosus]
MEVQNENCQVVAVIGGSPYSSRNTYVATKKNLPGGSKFARFGCCFWKILKSLILVLCLTFFFYQSVEFYHHYVTYPLSLSIAIENPQRFKKPAVTICSRNPFPRKWFCKEYPEFCQMPTEVGQFCMKHPNRCNGYKITLTPKIGYYAEEASDELINLLWDSFLNYSKRDMIRIRNLHSKSRNTWKKVPTIVQDPYSYLSRNVATGLYIKCVSMNLHLTSESEEEYEEISAEDGQLKKIAAFKIRQDPKDAFFAWKKEQVFVVVHSPFVPVDPVSDGTAVQPGYDYNFHINLVSNVSTFIFLQCTSYSLEYILPST